MSNVALTSSITVITAVLIFIFSQYISKFLIEPIYGLYKIRGEIAYALIFYANVIFNPDTSKEKAKEDAYSILRSKASLLMSQVHMIKWYDFFKLLNFVPKYKDIISAEEELIRLSNVALNSHTLISEQTKWIKTSIKKIEDALNIETGISEKKDEKMLKGDIKLKKFIARETLVILILSSINLLAICLNFLWATIATLSTKQVNFYKLPDQPYDRLYEIGISVFIFLYPIYLLIRFILWAIRMLKEKETNHEI